ncbi:MAG: hypothetical protein B5M55_08140 [Desulfococcus sp. 4484_242]|nr:MAG: hypothetical protein B5M55_08140 [Desulfococcus sp. 4484_242]
MEAICGAGGTVTGIVAAVIGAGIEIKKAAVLPARANRLAGRLARPIPVTRVREIVKHIPESLGLKEPRMMSGNPHVSP